MNDTDASAAQVRRLACWQGPVDIAPLGGGITNRNFTVRHAGDDFVVRIGEDIAEHNISRRFELAAARAAWAAGIGPEIVHAEPGALVMRRIEGRTLAPQDVREPAMLARILEVVRACHHEIPRHYSGPAPMFWVFQVLRDYSRRLAAGPSAWHEQLPLLEQAAAVLERAVGAIEVVFGHNDLLAANLIDDGRRLWLIDWEYAGFNSPLFDLGGLASNNELDADAESGLLEAYFGSAPDAGLLARYRAMKCASLLRETLWSMVSELHSALDFDYAAYTRENLARFEQAWRDFAEAR